MSLLEEKIFKKQLDNGLTVTLIQKKGFKSATCAFTTSFGGIYNKILVNGQKYELPLGVAHFLEHKLFSMEDGNDVTNKFSNIGLEVNAYTDYYNTTYYFIGPGDGYKGIELLLDFVQSPHFTDENVESEKGIIEQELLMYQDIPDEAASLGLMNNIFHTFPYINDVGGTVEEVNKITKEVLYFCYYLFYHPKNMNFVIVGDFEEDELFKFIEDNQSKKVFPEYLNPKIIFDEELDTLAKEYDCREMDVVNSKVLIGMKFPMRKECANKNEILLDDLYYRIIRNELFGGYTQFHQKLLDDKVICGPLRTSYNSDIYSQYLAIGAEVNDADEFIKRIKKRIKALKTFKFTQNKIDRVKKDAIGKFILSFNNIEAIMGDYLDSLVRDYDYINFIDIINLLNIDELREKSKVLLDLPITVYLINPKK